MQLRAPIQPCLWFDTEAEEAANYYVGIFPDSLVKSVARYGQASHAIHGMTPGMAMLVEFELDGQRFSAINGGPTFRFTEALSLQVLCADQQQIDYYWERLGEGGDESARRCGWLKDRYGLSWQIIPADTAQIMTGPHADAAMRALLGMKKIDLRALRADGPA